MALTEEQSVEEFASVQGDGEAVGNAAWTEAIGKIMRKQPPKVNEESVILSKNKEEPEENREERAEQRERVKQQNKKRKWEEMNYVKPSVLEKDYERSLQKIATRGVVQLFNAVKNHQKKLEEKLKCAKTETKKERVLKSVTKGEFLDLLKGGATGMKKSEDRGQIQTTTREPTSAPDNQGAMGALLTSNESRESSWDVLKDDFMMGNNLKDWDKKSDAED